MRRLVIAVDAGLIINPDGVANQIEGGAIQATSWTLKEAVRFDRSRVTSDSWQAYPILRCSEAPAVEVEIVSRPDCPAVGVGEAAPFLQYAAETPEDVRSTLERYLALGGADLEHRTARFLRQPPVKLHVSRRAPEQPESEIAVTGVRAAIGVGHIHGAPILFAGIARSPVWLRYSLRVPDSRPSGRELS